MRNDLIDELAKAKAIFQQRAIVTALGINPPEEVGLVHCDICGDHHEADKVPYSCETGDGV